MDKGNKLFHAGELELQFREGYQEQVAKISKNLIHNAMTEQHRQFFSQLPFVLTGTLDAAGQPWASLLANPPGFIQSPSPTRLSITASPLACDQAHVNFEPEAAIALLGIEQHTRRRNRVNGVITAVNESGIEIETRQAYGNCAKYIQARKAVYRDNMDNCRIEYADALDPVTRDIIGNADTFFIASAHPQAMTRDLATHGTDVSHRGGKPGFVKVLDNMTLFVPDFSGNRLFNTLGNLLLYPRAGLLFIDFSKRVLLQVAASAEIVFDAPAFTSFAGAERFLRFSIHRIQLSYGFVPLYWDQEVQYSPQLARTGDWPA